jgi:hypothetical protein
MKNAYISVSYRNIYRELLGKPFRACIINPAGKSAIFLPD